MGGRASIRQGTTTGLKYSTDTLCVCVCVSVCVSVCVCVCLRTPQYKNKLAIGMDIKT